MYTCTQFSLGLYRSSAPAGIQRFFKSGKNPDPAKILPEPDVFAGFGKMRTSNAKSIFRTKIAGVSHRSLVCLHFSL